jgi:hypothetical protein
VMESLAPRAVLATFGCDHRSVDPEIQTDSTPPLIDFQLQWPSPRQRPVLHHQHLVADARKQLRRGVKEPLER